MVYVCGVEISISGDEEGRDGRMSIVCCMVLGVVFCRKVYIYFGGDLEFWCFRCEVGDGFSCNAGSWVYCFDWGRCGRIFGRVRFFFVAISVFLEVVF